MLDKFSQRSALLEYLKNKREGAYIYEFMTPRPNGLGIARYSARIFELRKDGWDIRMDRPGHYYLQTEPVQTQLYV